MPTLPMTALLAAAAALAPHAAHADTPAPRSFVGRALLRATSGPTVRPLLSAAARPMCGNSLTKGGERRTCTDEVGTTTYHRFTGRDAWVLAGRTCARGTTTVYLAADGVASVVAAVGTGDDQTFDQTTVAAGAASPEPLVAACRAGLR
ncbi:MAG: hypothetical protein R3B06_28625 [Kofleriaceae bacterium]